MKLTREKEMPDENLETVRGIVKTITHHNPDNGFTIAKIQPEKGRGIVAVKGTIRNLSEGETVVLRGYWYEDPKWGRQFKFHSYESVVPSSVEGIKRFLSSRYMKGVGEATAEKIIAAFGNDTARIIEEQPQRLYKLKGIRKNQADSIIEGWKTHRRIRDIMIFLRSHDISETYATKIYEKYGPRTIDIMKSNPYTLIKGIRGIGFVKADVIASKMGISPESNDRIRAGIMYCLDDFVEKGNVYVPVETLIESASGLLEVDTGPVAENIEYLKKNRDIVMEEGKIYRADLFDCENELTQRIRLFEGTPRQWKIPTLSEMEKMLGEIEVKTSVQFASLQKEAIIKAVSSNVMILTGGPGTGKTTTVRGIIELLKAMKLSVLLCAPTGRAAKRLSETTGMEAKTIHRLLEYNPMRGKFTRNQGDPLAAHVVIMDEASMVDTFLMTDFLRAVSPYTTLLIVGDVDQLPSIGPGNILRDLINSGCIQVIKLSEIFRQAARSRIVLSAHLINSGRMPHCDNLRDGNFFIDKKTDPSEITKTIVEMVTSRICEKYGFDPVNDIQVLSPMHKGETGVERLNQLLQERLNPVREGTNTVTYGHWNYRVGDKVMQVRNNYDKMVFNGDIGRVVNIDSKGGMVVKFDDNVEYALTEIEDLAPAYAISVHKSQGSEFRCVVMPVSTQHFIMLKRNLLYTAVTRARELAVVVGDMKAVAIAVKNDQVSERYTSLEERLRG